MWSKQLCATAVEGTTSLAVTDKGEIIDIRNRTKEILKESQPRELPKREWHEEPTVQDIDRSIPQVDVQFVAELLGRREAERQEKATEFFEARRLRREQQKDNQEEEVFRVQQSEDKTQLQSVPGVTDRVEEDTSDYVQHEYEDGIIMIDCRTVNEVTSWGMIDTAKILPAHEYWSAMHMSEEEFQEMFGFRKPDKQKDTLLFYCQYGSRSLIAAQIASFLGYEKVIHLRKGYYEWGKQYNLLCSRFLASDLSTGYNNKRLQELHAARGISRDIAPELNKIVDKDMDAIKLQTSRSYGKLQIPMPSHVQQMVDEIGVSNDDREKKLLAWEKAGKNILEETLREKDERMRGDAEAKQIADSSEENPTKLQEMEEGRRFLSTRREMSGRIGEAQFTGARGGLDAEDAADMSMPVRMKSEKGTKQRGHFISKTRKWKGST